MFDNAAQTSSYAAAAGGRQHDRRLARSMNPATLTLSPWEAERGFRAAQNYRHARMGALAILITITLALYYSVVLPPVFHVMGALVLLVEARARRLALPARRWRCATLRFAAPCLQPPPPLRPPPPWVLPVELTAAGSPAPRNTTVSRAGAGPAHSPLVVAAAAALGGPVGPGLHAPVARAPAPHGALAHRAPGRHLHGSLHPGDFAGRGVLRDSHVPRLPAGGGDPARRLHLRQHPADAADRHLLAAALRLVGADSGASGAVAAAGEGGPLPSAIQPRAARPCSSRRSPPPRPAFLHPPQIVGVAIQALTTSRTGGRGAQAKAAALGTRDWRAPRMRAAYGAVSAVLGGPASEALPDCSIAHCCTFHVFFSLLFGCALPLAFTYVSERRAKRMLLAANAGGGAYGSVRSGLAARLLRDWWAPVAAWAALAALWRISGLYVRAQGDAMACPPGYL